jgi:phage replication O-like protein O
MANPSLKNGYISVANELVEHFATLSIPASEMRLVWVVWRKTWGWTEGTRHKDWDWIALSQFEKKTGMKHSNVAKALKSLVVKRILLKRERGYKFNQNYEEWSVCKRLPPVVKRIPPSMQTTTKSSSQTHTNKRKKETNTKETSKALALPGDQINQLIDLFEPLNPVFEELYRNTTERAAIDWMASKWGVEKLANMIEALPSIVTKPYAPKITKPTELKREIPKLLIFIKQEEGKRLSKPSNVINV